MAKTAKVKTLIRRARGPKAATKEAPAENAAATARSKTTPDNATPAARTDGKKPALHVVAQEKLDPKHCIASKEDKEALAAIAARFKPEAESLKSLKEQADTKRGGLVGIVFEVAQLAEKRAKKPAYMLAWFDSFTSTMEQQECERAQVDKVAEAMGSSWKTYKAQIRRCVLAGLLPSEYANASAYREAGGVINPNQRQPRQPRGKAAATDAQMESNAIAKATDPHVAPVLLQLIDEVKASSADDWQAVSEALMTAIVSLKTINADAKKDAAEEEARKAA